MLLALPRVTAGACPAVAVARRATAFGGGNVAEQMSASCRPLSTSSSDKPPPPSAKASEAPKPEEEPPAKKPLSSSTTTNVLRAIEEQFPKSSSSMTMEGAGKAVADSLSRVREMVTNSTASVSKAASTASAKATESKSETTPSATAEKSETAKEEEWYSQRVSFWMRRYENFVGLTEVKAAQERVVMAEREFIQEQERRREMQIKIREVQDKVKEIHAELEKTYRGEDRYLTLITQEHQVLKEEQRLTEGFRELEKAERQRFATLSNAVRDSHEKERAQAEKTKYWSVIGSVVGTCLGILGTTINNRLRMRELRNLVSQSASGERLLEVSSELQHGLRAHEDRLEKLFTQVQGALASSSVELDKVSAVRGLSERLEEIATRMGGDGRAAAAASAQQARRAEDIYKSVITQQSDLKRLFEDLKFEIQRHSHGIEDALLGRQKQLDFLAKCGEERDKMIRESFASLYRNQTLISEAFQERTRKAEEATKEVHTLIRNIQASATSRRDRETRALEQLDSSLLDKIEDTLEDHAARTRYTVLGAAVVVAGFVMALNKLF